MPNDDVILYKVHVADLNDPFDYVQGTSVSVDDDTLLIYNGQTIAAMYAANRWVSVTDVRFLPSVQKRDKIIKSEKPSVEDANR
jgi:hypothetical protein